MFNVWDAHVIFDLIKNKLEHENDGLIFTIDAAPYYMGSCHHILKWKPEHLNTIDFNAFPISKTPLNDTFVWSLHTRHGDLFDFICLSKIDNEKYLSDSISHLLFPHNSIIHPSPFFDNLIFYIDV